MAGLAVALVSCSSGGDVAPPDTTSSASAVAWASFGFDVAQSRFNPDENEITAATAGSLAPVWSADGLAGMSSTPSVVDGVVYVGDWSGRVLALDATDGHQVWTADLGQAITSSVTIDGDAVYASSNSTLSRLDRATGALMWVQSTSDHPDAQSPGSPLVVDDMVVQGVASLEIAKPTTDYTFVGSIAAFDAATGTPLWRLATTTGDAAAGNGVGVWSTPTYDSGRGLIYVGTGQTYEPPNAPLSDSLLAIRATTGELVWSRQFTAPDVYPKSEGGLDADVGTGPNQWTANGVDLVGAGDKAGSYHALDRDTGEVVWETKLTPGSNLGGVQGTAALGEGSIFVVSNIGNPANNSPTNASTLFALDTSTGTPRWKADIDAAVYAAVTAVPGVVLVGTTANELLAFSTDDGSPIWEMTTPAAVGAGASVVDGTVYWGYGFVLIGAPGNDGGVIALRPSAAGATTTTEAAQRSTGAQIFRTSCASCHGIDGRGGTGPNLIGIADRLTVEEHRATVEAGRNQMPAFGNALTDAEIDAVVDFERNGLDQ